MQASNAALLLREAGFHPRKPVQDVYQSPSATVLFSVPDLPRKDIFCPVLCRSPAPPEPHFPQLSHQAGKNPEKLRAMVAKTKAHSTDLQSPESVDHLCSKCDQYALNWKPTAEKLWNKNKDID